MEFACQINKKIHLLYYPPYHSKCNPFEKFGAVLENYWSDINTTKNVRWKSIAPKVDMLDRTYENRVKLTPKQMKEYDKLLIRKSTIPKWDVEVILSQEMRTLFIE